MTTLTSYLAEILNVYPTIFAGDLLRYVLGAGGVFLLVNTLLSGVLRGRRIRERKLPDGQIRRELLTSFRTVLVFSLVGGLAIWTSAKLGLSQTYADPAGLGWLWFAVSVVILIVLHDAYFYWTHRIIHHPRLFRRFHRTHHRSNNPTPFTSYAFDTEEAVINAVYLLAMSLVLPLSYLAIFIFVVHMMLRNAIGHCGYEVFPRNADGRPYFDWLATVTHHDLHHAEAGWNYGLYFTFWDRLMGTEHPRYHERFAAAVGHPNEPRGTRTHEPLAMVLASSAVLAGLAIANSPIAHAEAAQAQAPIERISGEWASQGYGVVVRLGQCASSLNTLCGDLVWAWDPSEIKPDTLNTEMLSGFRFEQDAWRGGYLKNPEDGNIYRGSIVQRGDDLIDLKGCFAIFCQSQTWRRLQSLPHIAGLSEPSEEGSSE